MNLTEKEDSEINHLDLGYAFVVLFVSYYIFYDDI